jgi:hypothetical protein
MVSKPSKQTNAVADAEATLARLDRERKTGDDLRPCHRGTYGTSKRV